MKRSPMLPIVLATFALLALLALWPQEEPTATIVVAAQDLGAGAILAPSDLKTITLPLAQVPADAVSDPALLVGESLAHCRQWLARRSSLEPTGRRGQVHRRRCPRCWWGWARPIHCP